jgi:polar amino acid transport system substrate-binding protein
MRTRALAIAFLLASLFGSLPSAAQAPGAAPEGGARRVVLRFLTTSDFPPFNYQDEEGVLSGFNVDLARAICLDLSVACNVEARPWDDLLPTLARREADAVIAGHIITAKALARADFSDRYFHTPGRFAGRREGPDFDVSPSGLDGRTIGVVSGTAHEAYADTFFRSSSLQRFPSPELARDALVAGRLDLVFDDGISLVLWINGTLSKDCCELKGGPFLEPKFFGDGMAIAVGKNDRELRMQLNQALRRVRASGRFEELVLRYFPDRVY